MRFQAAFGDKNQRTLRLGIAIRACAFFNKFNFVAIRIFYKSNYRAAVFHRRGFADDFAAFGAQLWVSSKTVVSRSSP